MRVVMGIVRSPSGIFYARKKVPHRLAEAVAQVTDAKAARLSWLKRSLATRDLREANIVGKPILVGFDRIFAKAEALLKPLPVRDTLSAKEIERIADYFYAEELAEDDDIRQDGTGSEALFQTVARQVLDAGIAAKTIFATQSPPPAYGLSEREMAKIGETFEAGLALAQHALARGDTAHVEEEMDEMLAVFRLNLDRKAPPYRQLGLAILRKKVAALQALSKRQVGEPVETPRVAEPAHLEDAVAGSSLRAAFEGWKKTRTRGAGTVAEFERAICLFEQLHGNIPVASITRSHVRQYREALQAVPIRRSGKLRRASLPELVERAKKHPESPRLAAATINKLIAGPMAIASWAHSNGIIPEDTPWANPFAKMLLDVDEAQREPWDIAELRTLFISPVFTRRARPKAGRGEAAYWLPLLGMFTGARLGELGSLTTSDIVTDEATGIIYLRIAEDETRGRKLKTASSRRVIPVHPTLVQLGFLTKIVEPLLCDKGSALPLFPALVPGPRGLYSEHWSKWFGRYIRDIGIHNKASVFHSFRHGFKDALRAAGISEDVNDALTGHAGGGVGRSYGAKDMIRRFGLPRLAEAVAKVEYPGLDLSHLPH
jgi:integrase